MKKNFYAIYLIEKDEKIIVDSWQKCEQILKGNNHLQKGFVTKEEAEEWLNSLTAKDINKHNAIMDKIKSNKQQKIATNKSYTITIDKELAKKFDEKLRKMHFDAQYVLNDCIKEWVDDE